MSEDGGTEERTLPPSERKLRKAREKGQVFRSTDMVAGACLSSMLLYLWLILPELFARLRGAMMLVGDAGGQPFREAAGTIGTMMYEAAVPYLARGAAIVVLMSLVVNVAVTKGIVFSLDPIKPRAERLHPAKGLKRIFALKSLIELVKSLVKTTLLVTISVFVLAMSLNSLVHTPGCGLSCLAPVIGAVMAPLVVAAIVVLMVGGLIDVLLQRGLFMREMRMTRSEAKRERRDQEGLPEVRSAQRRQHQSLAHGGGRGGIESATLVIEGDDVMVGLRYVPGETQVPRLVCKGRSVRAHNLTEAATELGIPRLRNPDLAAELDRRIAQDHYITEEFFQPVASALRASGMS
ncbi:EscU/YscU/HrcU family type III secretion system export apparatus switch protein [Bradyrhizobium sp. HKCCYLRH1073]|uniref:EscU/YscU/HrcU family type III secretion system export apparatus switch protein n=1 Tax=unclassified Bradyrhizobium TaxID=2631580 RepID=UPI0028E220A6|nr:MULTISPECIES: EscU/YscU/HrcU family type III secretion system export apparatus switch protein [unclassified Bradyrhizobium]